ncbi:four helix bundle protein [Hymenobacter sp. BT186]|uniref:Four helix bundle protein n=1 Tax=Hymenobacter telluris TaxID=2816474 RepID=A0A939F1H0_9BACT|nr:four helix bundle protein [Hymenobacter telluris]MBO0361006.1 four helix bundle protein [Hymenobacter telluris]MBW3377034.1 four helix bundle protein [Hymenobacter norwichensis]
MEGRSYTDLLIWQRSRQLANAVYQSTQDFPQKEVFGLTSQIRRSAVSIPSNIAEGCGRQHAKDAISFFYIARGSLYELETQLYLSFDQRFLSEETLNTLLQQITDCKKLLHGFINHYKSKLGAS